MLLVIVAFSFLPHFVCLRGLSLGPQAIPSSLSSPLYNWLLLVGVGGVSVYVGGGVDACAKSRRDMSAGAIIAWLQTSGGFPEVYGGGRFYCVFMVR